MIRVEADRSACQPLGAFLDVDGKGTGIDEGEAPCFAV